MIIFESTENFWKQPEKNVKNLKILTETYKYCRREAHRQFLHCHRQKRPLVLVSQQPDGRVAAAVVARSCLLLSSTLTCFFFVYERVAAAEAVFTNTKFTLF